MKGRIDQDWLLCLPLYDFKYDLLLKNKPKYPLFYRHTHISFIKKCLKSYYVRSLCMSVQCFRMSVQSLRTDIQRL